MTNDEYKISCEGLSHCPQHKYGKKRWGDKDYFHCVCKDQLHDTIGESCFLFCDVNSDHTCGVGVMLAYRPSKPLVRVRISYAAPTRLKQH